MPPCKCPEKVPKRKKSNNKTKNDAQPNNRQNVIVVPDKPSGKTITFLMKPSTPSSQLLTSFSEIEGIPPDQIRLIHAGRQMTDFHTLREVGVKDQDIIHMVLCVCGC